MDVYNDLIGTTCHIRRSNGRVHQAVISRIDLAKHCCTVEWFENDDTKGKELPLEAIFELNPELKPESDQQAGQGTEQPEQKPKRPASRRTHMPNRKTINPQQAAKKNIITSEAPPEGPQKPQKQESAQTVVKSSINNVSRLQQPSNNNVSRLQQPSNNNVSRLQPPKTQARQSLAPKQQPFQVHNNKPATKPTRRTEVASVVNRRNNAEVLNAVNNKKKNNVVDEVEKLRKNREERREKQNQERERRINQSDPSNVHWEFSDMIEDYRDGLQMNPLTTCGDLYDQRISVCVRVRPLNKKEINRKELSVTTIPTADKIMIHEPKKHVDLSKYLENHAFRFDYTFNDECNNQMVYYYTAKPLVQCIFDGGMATCFAYGQTGSGKTHTMGGDFTLGKQQDTNSGIYALAAQDVFTLLEQPKYKAKNLELHASFFEIYSGKVFDLLNKKTRLRVLEDGKQQVQVVGLEEVRVTKLDQVLQLITQGTKCRTSGQTSANAHSSRSHAVFQLILRSQQKRRGKGEMHGKFSLIDLAGNERGADTTSADRQTRIEGAEINKSLLALKECIRAMSMNKKHTPFRASKLTQVLRDSFIGERSRTCMIATLSPGMLSCEHTLNTLRYANRVKELDADDENDRKKIDANQFGDNFDNKSTDLELIESLCEDEVSQEMFEIHKTVSTLQEIEEDTVQQHREFIQGMMDSVESMTSILDSTDQVDFDQEEYINRVRSQLENLEKLKSHMSGKLNSFEKQLNEEEQISRKNMKSRNGKR